MRRWAYGAVIVTSVRCFVGRVFVTSTLFAVIVRTEAPYSACSSGTFSIKVVGETPRASAIRLSVSVDIGAVGLW